MLPIATWVWLGLGSEVAAHHEVELTAGKITVDTTWAGAGVSDSDGRIALAVPLPADVLLDGAVGDADAAGNIVALVLDEPQTIRPHVRVALALDEAQRAGALPLPIARGSDVQRVRVTDALAFDPNPALGLLVHLGHTSPATLGHRERAAIDARLTGARPRLGALYIPTDSIVRVGQVGGTLEARSIGRRRTAVGIGVVFVVLCGAGGWAYRRSRRHAQAEHADLVLAAEFDALDTDRPQDAP